MNKNHIESGLAADAGRIEVRRPEKVNGVKIKEYSEHLKRFLKEKDLSQAKFAKTIGVSSAAISQFLGGKYKGDVESLVEKIVDAINNITLRDRNDKAPAFINTSVAKQIDTLIKHTFRFSSESEGKCGVCVGDGGHGKSLCLQEYARVHPNAKYIQLDDAMTSTSIFSEIAAELGLDSSGTRVNITRRIIDAIANRSVILILDEASSLTASQLNLLRQVIMVKAHTPLILSGNSGLLKTIMQPTTRRGAESLDQFTSRLVKILNLDKLASGSDGGSGLYSKDDIRNLYEFGGIRLTKSAVNAIGKICKTARSGRLRTCMMIIDALHSSRQICDEGKIAAEDIRAAIRHLDLPVNVYLPMSLETAEQDEIDRPAAMTA
jgi:DNA transposition AAA+ family ATPase